MENDKLRKELGAWASTSEDLWGDKDLHFVIQKPHACEKQKAAWEKFEAEYREFDIGMRDDLRDDLRNGYDAGYAAAAKERDELIESLKNTNRKLHRRCQQIESPWAEERDRAKAEAAMWRNQWSHEFDRLGRLFDYCKQVYELCAQKLNLPYGKYHSFNDCSFAKEYGGYCIVVAPIIKDGTEVAKYELLSVVKQALAEAKAQGYGE